MRSWSHFGHSGWFDLWGCLGWPHAGEVFALIFGMMICLALALAVVGLVAVPARRDGRELLTDRGEELIGSVRERRQRP